MVRPKILIASSVHLWNDIRIYYKETLTLAEIADIRLIAVHNDRGQASIPENVHISPLPLVKSRIQYWGTPITRLKRIGKILVAVLKRDYDLFHFHDPELIAVGWVAKLLGKKVIYDMHEDSSVMFRSRKWLAAPAARLLGWMVRLLELVSLPIFDRIILAAGSIQRTFRSPNCSLVQNYPLRREIPQPVLRPDKSPLKIVYVGSLSTARGITDLVEAVAQVWSETGKVTLDIFGPPGEQGVTDLIRSPVHSDWLCYHGWVPLTELNRRLPEFHVGINPVRDYPNYRYSLLTKIFDYTAAGLPVITTTLPGIMEEFGDAGFLTSYPSGDVTGLATAVRQLFDEERRMSMAKIALDTGQQYSWDSQAQVLLGIYREVLA